MSITSTFPSVASGDTSCESKRIFRHKIELTTLKDVNAFVKSVETLPGRIVLCDGTGFCVNAKSLLGAMASIEWSDLYCESEEDIYSAIQTFCI